MTTGSADSTVIIPDASESNVGTVYNLVKEDAGSGSIIIETQSGQDIYHQSYQIMNEQGQDGLVSGFLTQKLYLIY